MLAGAMGRSFLLNPKTDYDNVKLMLYIGTNPMVSHSHNTGMFNPAIWIKAIAKRGEVWTIDPVQTETAHLSTRHIAAHPGKDYAILGWIVRELIDNGPMTPKQPIEGLGEVRAALEGYDRTKAALIAGVDEQSMEDLLASIRKYGSFRLRPARHQHVARVQSDAMVRLDDPGADRSMNEKGGLLVSSRLPHQI